MHLTLLQQKRSVKYLYELDQALQSTQSKSFINEGTVKLNSTQEAQSKNSSAQQHTIMWGLRVEREGKTLLPSRVVGMGLFSFHYGGTLPSQTKVETKVMEEKQRLSSWLHCFQDVYPFPLSSFSLLPSSILPSLRASFPSLSQNVVPDDAVPCACDWYEKRRRKTGGWRGGESYDRRDYSVFS